MKSRVGPKISIIAIALSIVVGYPRTSQAQFDPATITSAISFVASAYGYYQKAMNLLDGGGGPDLAAKLDQIQTNILGALATQRNQQWRANAQTVFDNYKILGYRASADPDNAQLWGLTIELSKTTLNLYAQLVDDVTNHISTDVNSNYQLAPMFNTLIATHTGLNKMKEEIFPNNGATWGENNIYLQRAIRVDYELIGSEHYICAPPSNPGAGFYDWALLGALYGRDPSTHDAQAHSQLWGQLTNHEVNVGSWTGTVYSINYSNHYCESSTQTIEEHCNPATGQCTTIRNGGGGGVCPQGGVVFPATTAVATAGINTARAYAASTWWNPDPVVQVVTAGMKGILTVGGGQASDSASITQPVVGKMTDPKVIEPACTSASSLAYPMLPTVLGNTPVGFVDGYQQTGDDTNIFPDSQVRLSSSATVARSDALYVPNVQNYTLVIRYAQGHVFGGVINVGLMNSDTGATMRAFSDTSFDPTPSGDWQLKRYNFSTTASWPTHVYARLAYQGGAITYVDAVWIEQQ